MKEKKLFSSFLHLLLLLNQMQIKSNYPLGSSSWIFKRSIAELLRRVAFIWKSSLLFLISNWIYSLNWVGRLSDLKFLLGVLGQKFYFFNCKGFLSKAFSWIREFLLWQAYIRYFISLPIIYSRNLCLFSLNHMNWMLCVLFSYFKQVRLQFANLSIVIDKRILRFFL